MAVRNQGVLEPDPDAMVLMSRVMAMEVAMLMVMSGGRRVAMGGGRSDWFHTESVST